MNKIDILKAISFGERVAEDETKLLEQYFVETDSWRRVYSGEVDVIYGVKGSGKSAIYSLLVSRTNELFDKRILLIPGENPRGALAFQELAIDPPATEREFVGLWKLYFLTLLHGVFDEYGLSSPEVRQIGSPLAGWTPSSVATQKPMHVYPLGGIL